MQVVTLFSPRSIRPICLPEFPTRNPKSSWVIFLANLSSRTLFPRAFRKSLSTTFCTYKSGSLKILSKAHVWVIFMFLIIFVPIRKDLKNRNNRCFSSLIATPYSKQDPIQYEKALLLRTEFPFNRSFTENFDKKMEVR